jgi:hypothetical protein
MLLPRLCFTAVSTSTRATDWRANIGLERVWNVETLALAHVGRNLSQMELRCFSTAIALVPVTADTKTYTKNCLLLVFCTAEAQALHAQPISPKPPQDEYERKASCSLNLQTGTTSAPKQIANLHRETTCSCEVHRVTRSDCIHGCPAVWATPSGILQPLHRCPRGVRLDGMRD